MSAFQCKKCDKAIFCPVIFMEGPEHGPIECSRCHRYLHPHCTDLKHENVWYNLGVARDYWKCYNCITFPPSDCDRLLYKRIYQLQAGELYEIVKHHLEKLAP